VQSKYPKDTNERPPVPIFVGGVSFGGLVAAHVCSNAVKYGVSVAGCVLVAPCCDVEWTPALRVQASIGSFLAKVAPDFRGAAAVTPERLSSDVVAIEEYRRDPLVRVANVRFKAAVEIMKGFEALRLDAFFDDNHFGNTPLLVMHGTNDAACHFPASAAFVKRALSSDKTFRAIENGSHLLLHDSSTAQTTRDEICVFVRSRAEAFTKSSHSLGPRVASDSVGRALHASRQGAVTEAAETDIGARL
jgi:alpha-beta hydrolase superfamily lysophospholipase